VILPLPVPIVLVSLVVVPAGLYLLFVRRKRLL